MPFTALGLRLVRPQMSPSQSSSLQRRKLEGMRFAAAKIDVCIVMAPPSIASPDMRD